MKRNRINHALVEAELNRLYQKWHVLTPRMVLDEAKKPSSPLHNEAGFEWNVHIAANRHWLTHARRLIKSIHVEVVVRTITVPTPVFVHNPDEKASSYKHIKEVQSETEVAKKFLAAEMRRVEAALLLTESYARILKMEKDFRSMLRSLINFRTRVETHRGTKRATRHQRGKNYRRRQT